MSKLHHVTFQSIGRLALAPTPRALLELISVLCRVSGDRLLGFGCAADHGHSLIRSSGPRDFGDWSSAVRRAFAPRTGKLAPLHVVTVEDADHLGTMLSYGPRQAHKHGLPDDPLLYPGSHLFDVLGARVLEGFDPQRLLGELPTVDAAATLAAALGIPELPAPASDESVRALGAHGLWAACCRALGVDGASRTANGELLRPAFVQVGRVAGIAASELLHASGASTSAYQRARHAKVPEPVERAVRLQVALAHLARDLPPHQRVIPDRAPPVVSRKPRRR